MSPDILLRIRNLLVDKGILDNEILDKFVLKIKLYSKGKWLYPGTFKRHLGVSSQVIYNALNLLNKDGILDTYYEVYCPKCAKTSGEVYNTISEIPEEVYCEICNKDIVAIDSTIMIYKVVDDGNEE